MNRGAQSMNRITSPMALWGKEMSEAQTWTLIESAHDLLTRLQQCEELLASGHEGGLFMEEVRATIARATGMGKRCPVERSKGGLDGGRIQRVLPSRSAGVGR